MSDALCAHQTVRYTTQQLERGQTRGWWECDSCRTKFVPMPTVKPPCPHDFQPSRVVDGKFDCVLCGLRQN